MADKPEPPGGAENPKQETEITNKQVKSHPLFLQLTQQVAELTQKDEERSKSDEQARIEKEAKKLEEKQQYEQATQLKIDEAVKKAVEESDARHAAEQKCSEAKIELVRLGFSNEKFLKGALADFDPAQEAAEFAKSIFEDEANKPFLNAAGGTKPKRPDPPDAPIGSSGEISKEKLLAMRNSSDPAERKKSFEITRENLHRTGKTGL